ncbi:hypothetical protein AB0L13_26035 [Saccharopolyspora shandongensis]|uniref:hypothetical protein n=1 Tax=Saccharopolyspora shandongensis TaxID=418495 RepID=UPI003439505C
MFAGDAGERIGLDSTGEVVGQKHPITFGAQGGEQGVLGHGDRGLVMPGLHTEVAGKTTAAGERLDRRG